MNSFSYKLTFKLEICNLKKAKMQLFYILLNYNML